MTQPPPGGQTAPVNTGFGSVPAARHASSTQTTQGIDAPSGNGSAAPGAAASNAAPWGSTSRSSSAPQHTDARASWSPPPAPPADAPTAAVPLVSGTAAPAQRSAPSSSGLPPGAQNTGAPSYTAAPNRARPPRSRGPRRARLQLRHVNPWTVLKFSCVLSIALFFVWLIVVGVLFGVLDGAGVIGKINDAYTTIQGGNAKAPITAPIVFGVAAIIGVVDIILFIALSTVGSVVYNLCADLVGGIEVTLAER